VTRCILFLMMLLAPGIAAADSVVLILNGVPGSPEHAERFLKWSEATRSAMLDTFGFAPEDVIMLSNRDARADDIRNVFDGLKDRLGPTDLFFVFFIGHGSFDGADYKFNIMGADLTASDYSDLLSSLGAGRSVIVNATTSSGGAIEALAGQNRIIVTATRSGTERNDTIFYDYFLEGLTEETSDEDKNQKVSVWEAFRYATLGVERFYSEQTRLATEHPQISDNGSEKTGVEAEKMPVLARMVHFNVEATIDTDNPVLLALLEEKGQLEQQIESLRLIKDALPAEEYDSQMETLLIELALKNQEIRTQEPKQ
jgi:hypothetical protein